MRAINSNLKGALPIGTGVFFLPVKIFGQSMCGSFGSHEAHEQAFLVIRDKASRPAFAEEARNDIVIGLSGLALLIHDHRRAGIAGRQHGR